MSDFIYKLPSSTSTASSNNWDASAGGAAIDNSTSNSGGSGLTEQQVRDIVNSVRNNMTEARVREIVNGMQKFLTGQNIMVDGIQKSQNFYTGVSGWQIDAEGNAEFNNGTFRGTFIVGGTLITISDIADLDSAITTVSTAGGGTVSLVPGTYSATQSYSIPSGVTVDGNGSTIDFGGGAYQFLIQGTNAYSTGTITATFGSVNIVGVGTTWTAGMVGQSILIGDYWYVIASRTDNTHIALTTNFIGTNLSGDTYVIATTVDGPALLNLTLYNSSTKLVEIRYVNLMTMDSIVCDTGTYGVYVRDSGSVSWLNSTITNCTSGGFYGNNIPFSNLYVYFVTNIIGTGIDLIRDTNAAFNTGSIQAITGVGVKMTNCANMDYAVFSVIQCTSHGVEFVSGNAGMDLIDGYINTCGGDGVKFTASNTGIQAVTTSIYNTTGYGINIAAFSNNSITVGINYYSNCTAGNVNDSGAGSVILGDDTAYAASWNGNLGTPTKNAVYDKMQTVIPDDTVYGSGWNGSLLAPTQNAVYDKIQSLTSSFPAQEISLISSGSVFIRVQMTSDSTGTVMFVAIFIANSIIIYRLLKDTSTGNYYKTVTPVTLSISGTQQLCGICILGNYLYVGAVDNNVGILRRYDKADLANVTSMTISGTNSFGATDRCMWADSTQIYVWSSSGTFRPYTISGTTATAQSTVAFTSAGNPAIAAVSDGTNVWITDTTDGTIDVRKYPIAGGAVSSTTSPIITTSAYPNGTGMGLFLGSSSVLGIGWIKTVESNTAVKGTAVQFTALTLP